MRGCADAYPGQCDSSAGSNANRIAARSKNNASLNINPQLQINFSRIGKMTYWPHSGTELYLRKESKMMKLV